MALGNKLVEKKWKNTLWLIRVTITPFPTRSAAPMDPVIRQADHPPLYRLRRTMTLLPVPYLSLLSNLNLWWIRIPLLWVRPRGREWPKRPSKPMTLSCARIRDRMSSWRQFFVTLKDSTWRALMIWQSIRSWRLREILLLLISTLTAWRPSSASCSSPRAHW